MTMMPAPPGAERREARQVPAASHNGSKRGGCVYQASAASRPGPGWPHVPPRHVPPGGIVLIGAHGGAGVTTLTALLRPAWDMGAVSPPGQGLSPLRPGGRPVVLVTRGTVAASGRATAAVRALDGQGVPVAVLAVTGDGLPEPAEARYRFRLLEDRVGAVVRVPYIPALRVADDPLRAVLPRRARRALAEIRSLAGLPQPAGDAPVIRP
jgi:hypothetical protein